MSFLASFGPFPTLPKCTIRQALWWRVAVCQILLASSLAQGEELRAPEPQVKAAFLYNFTKLVEWPTNAFGNPGEPLVIGVLGNDPFGRTLDDLLEGRVVNNRRVVAARFTSVAEIENCHVLFISESERRNLDSIFTALGQRPILTVGDMRGFESRGMITLVRERETIGLRINLEAASQAGLGLSSRLTRLDPTQKPRSGASTNAPPTQPE